MDAINRNGITYNCINHNAYVLKFMRYIYVNSPESELLKKYSWYSNLNYIPNLGFRLSMTRYNEYMLDYKYSVEYELKLMEDNNIKYKQTLYSRNATGKILVWNIQVVDEQSSAIIVLTHGEINGRLVKRKIVIEEGKNIGRSNETTPLSQAISEAKSKYIHKLNQGYVQIEDPEKIDTLVPLFRKDADGDLKPMLAQKFERDKLSYPQILQPKLNGVRCEAKFIIKSDGLFGEILTCQLKSRDGKIYNVKHIENDLLKFAKDIQTNSTIIPLDYDELIFDGELYCHGMLLQDIVSAVKKPNEDTHKIQYWIYDIKSNDIQKDRIKMLETYADDVELNTVDSNSSIVIIESKVIHSDDQAVTLSEEYIKQGYEGGIVREPNAIYQYGKRSKYLRKIKKVHDKEFLLVDIIESGNDNYNGQPIGMFVCLNDSNNLKFKVTPQATKKERYEYLQYKNNYIGKKITVFFRERTKDKIPFHCNGIIRDYE